MKFRTAIALLSLAITASAFAADAPKPDPKLRQLDYFAGTWTCKGTETFGGPTIHYSGEKVVGKWAFGNYWLDVRVTQMHAKSNPMPLDGRGYLGYDAQAGKFVVGWVDNTGGYETAQFDGWDGNKIWWEGTYHMGSTSMKARDTFTKISATKQKHTMELEQDGKWVEAMSEMCTK